MLQTYSFYNRPKSRATVPVGESKTVLGHDNDVNIHQIVARARKRQAVPISYRSPIFGDFTGTGDFHNVQNRLIEIREEFMTLPAKVREKFGHDEIAFMMYVRDPKNRKEAEELGLIEKAPEVPPDTEPAPAGAPAASGGEK